MLLRTFLERFRFRPLDREERGVAMVVVAILVVFCATVSLTVASSTIFGSRQTAMDRSQLQALAAAEAGRDALLSQVETSAPGCPAARTASGTVGTSTYTATAAWAASVSGTPGNSCPSDGTIRITATGTAANGVSKTVVAWYPYRGNFITATATSTATVTATTTTTTTTTVPTVQGAIIQGSAKAGALNLPSVATNPGDLLVASTGMFDCNSNSAIKGDLIVPNGSVSLSNQCTISGSVYAKGNIQINNLGNHVGGDLVSATGNVTINAGGVDGSVKAAGTVTFTGATVGKAGATGVQVVSGSAGATSIYGSTIKGSVSIAGYFSQLQSTSVTGSVSATSATQSKIAPDVTIGGSLTLAGPAPDTWNGGPTVSGGQPQYNVKGMVAPTVSAPTALSRSTWVEIPWKKTSWTSAGWTVATASAADCNYQGSNNALVTAINNLTVPTVIDASACGVNGLNLYGATFSLKTDVTFIASAFDSAQNITINRNGTGIRQFNVIVPDGNSSDNAPTCPAGANDSTIYGAKMGAGVVGIAYSPCTLAFGTVSWAGQIVAGDPDPAGGNLTIAYQGVGIPGSTAGSGATATATLTATATATTTSTVTTTATISASATPSTTPSILQQTER